MTRFAEVASAAVGATRSRTEKLTALADLLRRLEDDELVPTVAWLSGGARQGRIGVGWATVTDAERDLGAEPAGEPSLTIGEVDATFERLAGLVGAGAGSNTARRTELAGLLRRATPPEADLLWRLFVGELRHGALEGLVTDAVARANDLPLAGVRRAAMLAGDLPTVAALARNGGAEALAEVGLTVGRPVSPMLAATAADVATALAEIGMASVEWKLDGARIQAHRDGNEVRLWTRNLNEVTERLPGIVALVRSFPATHLVLDGEAIGHHEPDSDGDGDRDEGKGAGGTPRPHAFQETMSRFGTRTGDAGAGLGARFFDILHVDGVDLLDAPLAERRAELERVTGAAAIPQVTTDDPEIGAAFLAEALATGHEGVMVKAVGSPYEAGRRGKAWRKVKPVRTLDLVVLAAEWGHGRRQGWLSNLHLGALDPDGTYGEAGAFVMVGKTFKGLTDALLTWQTEALQAIEARRTQGTVWVRPELVVEIALDGVQRSTRYPGGVALRFARVRAYREDKSPADADTIQAVRALLP
ncbi:MAG: ATP-dependent DNA ligase [Acidimicrobiales bacterium]|nr:ATP-dependent DNA ligase [Acidimicrobiales bacterium]